MDRQGSPTADDQLGVLEALGDAHERAGHPDDAHAAYKRARGLVPSGSPAQLRLLRKHARVAERAGAWVASLRWVSKGVGMIPADAGPDVTAERAELELAASVVRIFQGRTRQAADLARSAVVHADRAGSIRAQAQAEMQLEMCGSILGLPERAAHGLRALELFELLDDHLGLANLRLNLGADGYAESRWDQALNHYRRSAEEYEIVGDLVGAALVQNNRAEILTDQGRDDEALLEVMEARRGMKAAAYRMGVAGTSSSLGRLAVRRGDFAEADHWYAEARDEFAALDAAPLVADTDVRLLELAVWRGQVREASASVDRVRAFVDETEPSPMLSAAIARLAAWARTGPVVTSDRRSRTRIVAIWDEAVDAARRADYPYEVALALDGRVVVSGDRADQADRDECDALFRRLGVVRPPRPPWVATVTHSSGT
jgi:tetratricopeptide (TPR) repeat protein